MKPLPRVEEWAYAKPEEQEGRGFEEYKYNRVLLYDNTLRYVNEFVEEFLSAVKDLLGDSVLTVVTADHGEEFWEHALLERNFLHPHGICGIGHGHNLFSEIVEVPLLFMGPDTSKLGHNSDATVGLVDIVPTILKWLGMEYDERVFNEIPLFEKVPRDRGVISEGIAYGYEKKALIKGRYKLLYAPMDGVTWLFDLANDPEELKPIEDIEETKAFVYELKSFIARNLIRYRRIMRG